MLVQTVLLLFISIAVASHTRIWSQTSLHNPCIDKLSCNPPYTCFNQGRGHAVCFDPTSGSSGSRVGSSGHADPRPQAPSTKARFDIGDTTYVEGGFVGVGVAGGHTDSVAAGASVVSDGVSLTLGAVSKYRSYGEITSANFAAQTTLLRDHILLESLDQKLHFTFGNLVPGAEYAVMVFLHSSITASVAFTGVCTLTLNDRTISAITVSMGMTPTTVTQVAVRVHSNSQGNIIVSINNDNAGYVGLAALTLSSSLESFTAVAVATDTSCVAGTEGTDWMHLGDASSLTDCIDRVVHSSTVAPADTGKQCDQSGWFSMYYKSSPPGTSCICPIQGAGTPHQTTCSQTAVNFNVYKLQKL